MNVTHLSGGHARRDVNEAFLVRVINGLTYLLLLSILLQEARLGPSGLVFQGLSLGSEAGFRLPFLCEVVILVIVAAFLVGLATRAIELYPAWHLYVVAWMIYLAILIIPLSSLMGLEQGSGAFGYARMILESFMLFIVISNIGWRIDSLWRINWLFILVGVFHGAVIASSYLAPYLLPFPVLVISVTPPRYAGLFLQPSRVSLLLAVAFVMLLSKMLSCRSKLLLVACPVMLAVLGMGLWLSQTRAAYFAVGIGLLFLLQQQLKNKRVQRLLVLFTATAFVVMIIQLTGTVELGASRLGEIGADFFVSRGLIWPIVFGLILRYPIGMGYDALPALTGMDIPHAHNMYLQWCVMFGLPGLVLFLYFVCRVYLKVEKRMAQANSEAKSILSTLLVGWIVYLMASMSEPFFITNTGYWFWLISGLMVAPWSYQTERIGKA